MKKWNVYLRGHLVTSVFYTENIKSEEVKESLISHDHFSQNIEVWEG